MWWRSRPQAVGVQRKSRNLARTPCARPRLRPRTAPTHLREEERDRSESSLRTATFPRYAGRCRRTGQVTWRVGVEENERFGREPSPLPATREGPAQLIPARALLLFR